MVLLFIFIEFNALSDNKLEDNEKWQKYLFGY
jgi:hypothetical protein